MPDRTVEGVRLGHVRRCACGRDPEIWTGYPGFEPGFGPFVLKCYCGRDPAVPTPSDAHGIVLPSLMARSWSKTRGVRIWNRIARERAAAARDRTAGGAPPPRGGPRDRPGPAGAKVPRPSP